MTRTLVVEQPNYIPWIGYFDLISRADIWVWYDDVQYTKRDWRNRNRVAAGTQSCWLTIPVLTKGRYLQPIREVRIDHSTSWMERHLATVRHCYGKAPFFETIETLLTSAFEQRHELLADLTIALNEAICFLLGFAPRFVRSSHIPGVEGAKQRRLLDLCARVGADTYLSGPAAAAYIEPPEFEAAGIALQYINYDYPTYPRGPHPFVPRLSIIDPLAWIGPRATRTLILEAASGDRASC